jgi:hypothetical protein
MLILYQDQPMLNKRYTINESIAISETIDGETIIINLETGYYYSVNKTGTIIWNEFRKNNSIEHILKYFLHHYEVDKDTAEKSIIDTVNILLKDYLIVESDSDGFPDITPGLENITKDFFILPKIERYDDMARALTADPVHDVKEDGWPNLK